MEIHVDLLIERPASEVFLHAGSAQSQIQWVGSLVEVEVLTPEPWATGSRFRQVHEESGIRQVLEGEVLSWDVAELMQVRLVHPEFVVHSKTVFEDLGPRCRLVQATAIELMSLKLKLAAPMVRGAVEQRMRDDYQRLKALLES